MNLSHSDVFSKNLLPRDRRGRLRRRCWACLECLEDRTLLAGTAGDVLAGIAIPIALGTTKTGTLASGNIVFYQIKPTAAGTLMAQVQAGGVAMRLSLLNGQDQVLAQSDGRSPANPDDQIDVHVPAGPEYLEVEDLGVASKYTLTTSLTPSIAPFQPLPISVANFPTNIVASDFNGDGRTDLAVADSGSNDVSVLLGNGDGTFQTQVTYTVGSEPEALVAGDFRGDARTDLAVANSGDNDVSVLLGNGDGTFQTQVTYTVGSQPLALVAGDFTGDGRTDLASANNGNNDVSVLLGNGDGTFQTQVTYAVGSQPLALVAGDFNGDGRTDLASANNGNNDVSVLLSNSNGTFQIQVTYVAGAEPDAIVSGDFNSDGRTDLASANFDDNDVSVLLGNGDGTFQPQVTYAVGFGPEALVAGDFRGDGRTDLAAANLSDNDVSVLLGNGDGTFQNQVTYPVGDEPYALVAGDFIGDGRTDLAVTNSGDDFVTVRTNPAVANSGDDDVSVLLNLNGTFTAPGAFVTTPQATPLVADLTGDGVDDVIVVNGAGDVLWRRGRPQDPGTFDPPVTINPGDPSRDIVAVDTNEGPVLASVDATDDAVSLYAWRSGRFALIGSLATGSLPAQIVTADLSGYRSNDLVVRNAGDGTLSVYFNTDSESGPTAALPPPFLPPVTLPVGPGLSDVILANVSGDGRTDIIVTNQSTGEVGVLRNLSPGVFAPLVLYPAGSGLYAVTSSGARLTVTTLEATVRVAAGAFTAGGPTDLVATDPGSNTFSLLSGLGAGRFANPIALPTASPGSAILVADLEGNGIPDTIILSASGVTVDRGDGKGGFLPHPFTIDAGPNPTGMTVADINHDGKPDLLVGNAFGDLLVLLGNGDGTFQPYQDGNQNVALAVLPNGSPTPDFIFADQGLDRVVVDYRSGKKDVVADHSSGLLAPGALVLADLSGDGIPDLIVANSGSNNVLVYPGLGNGQFGPELNGGHGFFTGTNPVGITVANLNGRPDLVIANQGSNDVSILLNEATDSGGFTFVPGPRIQAGLGPTSTLVKDVTGDGIPDILVSDGGSNQVRLLPGVGKGFFVDQGPQVKTFALPPGSSDPIKVIVGTFLPNQGSEILTVNRDSNNVTVISDFTSITPVFDSFSTGGIEPVAAFGVTFTGAAEESLVVANQGDGLFTLLGGTQGLDEEAPPLASPDLPEPTALALAALSGNEVSFYATTAGMEAAFTLSFILPGFTSSVGPVPGSSSAAAEAPGQLVMLSETSLALVGTLLVTMLNSSLVTVLNTPTSATLASVTENQAEVSTSFLSVGPSQGQSLFTLLKTGESGGDEAVETEPETPVAQSASAPPWVRSVLGVDELFQRIRQENHDVLFEDEEPGETGKSAGDDEGEPFGVVVPPRPNATPHVYCADTQLIDEAIASLWALRPTDSPPTCAVVPEPTGPAPLAGMRALDAPDAPVSVWVPLMLSTTLIIHASPLAERLRDRRRGVDPLKRSPTSSCISLSRRPAS